ncbi:MAG: hypothetical protein JNL88_11575, partial [Bacteroidia bacterium]|nr:hypothetical protein [Bacteroidia bacterium]
MRLLLKIVLRYLLPFALLGVVLYAAVNFRLVQYGFAQLKGQAKIILGARDIDVVLGDPGFPDSL